MGYWSGSGGGGSGLGQPPKLVAAPTYDYGPASGGGPNTEFDDVGKTGLNLFDIPGSVMEGAGNLAGMAGGAIGGVLGGAVEAVSPITRKIGEVQLGPVTLGTAASLGGMFAGAAASGAVGTTLDVVSAPGRFVESEAARGRARQLRQLLDAGYSYDVIHKATGIDLEMIDAVDSGADLETIAQELVARNAGFSSNPVMNLANQVILDPMNLVAPGAAKGAQIAKGAGLGLRAGATAAELGLTRTFMGTVYNGLTKGMSTAGSATIGRVSGPATAGVFHALKVRPYRNILSGLDRISPDAASAFDDALARGTRQFTPASVARDLSDEAELALKAAPPGVTPEAALARFPRGEELQRTVGSIRPKAISEKEIARRTEALAQRVVPTFHNVSDVDRTAETLRKLAQIAGISEEDALRALGGKVSVDQARHVHLAFYGKAGSDLSKAVAASAHAKNIDPERLTLLAPQTLTDERAVEVLKLLDGTDADAVVQAVGRYEILSRKFAGDFDWVKVKAYIRNLQNNDALPHQVKLPKSGDNALPGPLSEWRKAYRDSGYEIGFGPKDGWKAIVDDAGEVIITDPFIHFIDEAAPLTVRNPLGRLVDSLMRGTTQTKIVQTAKQRLTAQMAARGIPDSDAERIFGRILDETRERRITPRAFDAHEYDRMFEEVLGPERFAAFRRQQSPVLTVMKAFEGNWREVGLTQKLSGRAKVWTADRGNFVAGIAEQQYPKLKFKYNPKFQLQELLEVPFFRMTRGIAARTYDDATDKLMYRMADQSAEMRSMWEAGVNLNIAGGEVAATIAQRGRIGRALARVPVLRRLPGAVERNLPQGIVGLKEDARIAQVFAENGEYFFNTINDVSPRLWKTMTAAYGTKNPNAVAKAFITERFRIINDETGDAVKAFIGKTASADEETVMQGFLEAWRQSSRQAFQTQYFKTGRGFLERTLNHPYLGLYPLSYMWGKVLPELIRFLVFRPFGFRAPLVGVLAFDRVREAVMEEQLTNPDFKKFIEDNGELVYFINMLIPGTPDNMPVNAPGWARHLSRDIQKGNVKIDDEWATREAVNAFTYASPAGGLGNALGAGADVVDIGGKLLENITRAAAEFDGMFPQGIAAPAGPLYFGPGSDEGAAYPPAPEGTYLGPDGNARRKPTVREREMLGPFEPEQIFNPNAILDPSQVRDIRKSVFRNPSPEVLISPDGAVEYNELPYPRD